LALKLFYPPSQKTLGVLRQAQDGEHCRTISPWMNAKKFLLRSNVAKGFADGARDFAPDEARGEVFDPECSDRRDTPTVRSRELHIA